MISMPRIGSRMMFIINLYGSVANLDYQDNPRDGCITIAPIYMVQLQFEIFELNYNSFIIRF